MFGNRLRQASLIIRSPRILGARCAAKAAYEGQGKTTVNVLNQDPDSLMIDSYATFGFRLNNGVTVLGPMAIFPRAVLSWQVKDSSCITPGSLKLFKILEPKIDLLIVGLEANDRPMMTKVFKIAKELQLNVEMLQTEHACSTFNFLNAEGRSIAGAFIPPVKIEMNEDDMLETKLHYQGLFTNPRHMD